MIKMDSKAQLTVDIIAKVAQGKIDIVNASRLLNKFRRTVERYLKKLSGTVVELIRIDFSSPASAAGINNLQFNTIPEPSSGLLVLVGWALLALRRPCGRLGKR